MAASSWRSGSGPAADAIGAVNILTTIQTVRKIPIPTLSRLSNKSGIESVTHSADVPQVRGIRRIGFDFAAEIDDVVIHDAVGGEGIWSPCSVEKCVAGQNAAARANEEREQAEFDGG